MVARKRSLSGFTLVELLVVIAIIGILIALLLPAVQAAREASRRSKCSNNIKQIALAVHSYVDARKELPTGAPRKPNPADCYYLIGWIGRVMPYMEQDALHDEVESLNNGNGLLTVQPWRHTTTPHDGTNARYSSTISAFFCPSSETGKTSLYVSTTVPHVKDQQVLHYRGVGGSSSVPLNPGNANAHANWSDSGVIFPLSQITFSDILDGTSNTFMVGEQSSASGWPAATASQWGTIQPWTWGYYNYNPPCAGGTLTGFLMIDHKFIAFPIGYKGAFLCNNSPFRSVHAGPGANFAMSDASVRFFSNNTSLTTLQRLATRKGGEAVTLP